MPSLRSLAPRALAARFRPFQDRFGPVLGVAASLAFTVARRLPFRVPLPVPVFGWSKVVWVRSGSSDIRVLKQLIVDGELDTPLHGSPATIVDAGANIGLASVLLARRFPEAQIVALEVEQANYDMLVRNTAAYPNVLPVRAGLWSRRCGLRIVDDAADEWAFQVQEVAAGTADAIQAVGVSDLVEHFGGHIDLLKVDIEGAEVEVFGRGAERWIDSVSTVAVEPHDRFAPGSTAAIRAATGGEFLEGTSGEYLVYSRRQAAPRRAAPALVAAPPITAPTVAAPLPSAPLGLAGLLPAAA